MEPIITPAKVTKSIPKARPTLARPKPATLVKNREPKKKNISNTNKNFSSGENENQSETKPDISLPSVSMNGRLIQTDDLQKLSRLSCSHEFSLFHKEMKGQLISHDHQLAFFQTKLFHLKNEFVNQMSQHDNLKQIRDYFEQELIKNRQRNIKPDEFVTLADKLKQDIKQVRQTMWKRTLFSIFRLLRRLENG